ncbi:hypothetical protein BN8_05174 [Fibrisoma limi BUZ 3]|uniref:Transposase DDE domain-containing protein n=1 Tax=Fibrisoma limi BUZ 3 TaxID=1185876 RepID=I2GPP9_9BACT|nr:hypothetical protein [Fibrisoma limi]CCH55877.1 hypothetical protein BN8_05174 [Fibrisoma limi BUZ 3]
MRVLTSKEFINNESADSKLVIHKWPACRCGWVVERTISWVGNNRGLAKGYEQALLSARSFVWLAHIRRIIKRALR